MKNVKLYAGITCAALVLASLCCTIDLGDTASSSDRSKGVTPDGEIGFHVSGGDTFSPRIVVESGATISWCFAGYDGGSVTGATSSNSETPSTSYTGTMLATLEVTPWSALTAIDIGYDGEDGGELDSSYELATQNVTAVDNLDLARDSLTIWCSSHNIDLAELSFSGFSSLETIEMYFDSDEDGGLSSLDLTGASSLARLCVENNNLKSLDLTDCVSLEDLRGALNDFDSFVWPGDLSGLWHLCVRDNAEFPAVIPEGSMPALVECYIWSDAQSGTYAPDSQSLSEVWIGDNDYDEIDLTGAAFAASPYELNANNCSDVTSVLVGASGVRYLVLNGCGLDDDAIAALLSDLAERNGASSGTLYLENNPGSVDASSADYAKLVGSMGWTVTY